jgi:hypothetical protein
LSYRDHMAEQVHAAHRQGWEAACSLHQHLMNGGQMAPIGTPGMVLHRDETAYGDVSAQYARFYGTNVAYTQHSGFFFGSPLFVAAGLVGNAIANSRARNHAQAMAAAQWRDHSPCRVVLTDDRTLVHIQAEHRWLSFYHGGIVGFHAVPGEWSLFTDYHDAEPMCLSGPAVPWLSVASTYILNRDRPPHQQLPVLPLPSAPAGPMSSAGPAEPADQASDGRQTGHA